MVPKMSLKRLLRHLASSPQALRRRLPASTLERIGQAIRRAEAGHQGEIRFAIEAALPWSYLWRNAPPRERALMVFSKLRVWDTEHNNGVLVYVQLVSRHIDIVADRGIGSRVEQAEWNAVCREMEQAFANGAYEDGALKAIERIAAVVARHFPR